MGTQIKSCCIQRQGHINSWCLNRSDENDNNLQQPVSIVKNINNTEVQIDVQVSVEKIDTKTEFQRKAS